MKVYLSSAYLPPVQYFAHLVTAESVYIERCDNYMKQTYRNRCSIVGANGRMSLTIPVEKPVTLKCQTCNMRISEHGNWRHLHWNALVSAYGTSPFFDYYADDLRPFYEQKADFLFDFNDRLMRTVLSWLGVSDTHISYTGRYQTEFDASEIDLREAIHPKKENGLANDGFQIVPYYQVFVQKNGFVPNQSIIDLIFNMGNEAVLTLLQSLAIEKLPSDRFLIV